MIKLYTRVKEKLKVYKQQTSKQYKYMNVTSYILRCTYHNNNARIYNTYSKVYSINRHNKCVIHDETS